MLSRGEICTPQLGQCEGGDTTDSPRGTRQITTFRNDPTRRPSTPATTTAKPYTTLPRCDERAEAAAQPQGFPKCYGTSLASSSRKPVCVMLITAPGKLVTQQLSSAQFWLPPMSRFFENRVPTML